MVRWLFALVLSLLVPRNIKNCKHMNIILDILYQDDRNNLHELSTKKKFQLNQKYNYIFAVNLITEECLVCNPET